MPGTTEDRPVDSTSARQRLLFVLSEAFEKVCRLQQILKGQQAFIAAEHAEGESSGAIDTLIGFLDDNCETFLDSSGLVASFLQGAPLNEAQESAIIAALEILITAILRVHELLLLLPREASKPHATFLLKDCFGLEDINAAIVLTNLISAYEYRFEDILKKVNVEQEERQALTQGGNVLCQAFADKDNPLAWAVLAHEYGHALDDNEAISQGILGLEGSEKGHNPAVNPKVAEVKAEWKENVISETVADFVAAHVLGPASLMPILFVEMMQPQLKKVERISAGHPPTPLRVSLVREYLKSLGVSTTDFEEVFKAYEHDYSQKLGDMEESEREDVNTMGTEAEKLLSSLAPAIASRVNALGLRRFQDANSQRARALRTILESRQPISSMRSISDGDIFKALSALRVGESTPEQAYEILTKLDEVPVAASEILTAGWLYRLATFERELSKAFPDATGQQTDLSAYAGYVSKTDGLLLKSLELVAVHTRARQRLTKT